MVAKIDASPVLVVVDSDAVFGQKASESVLVSCLETVLRAASRHGEIILRRGRPWQGWKEPASGGLSPQPLWFFFAQTEKLKSTEVGTRNILDEPSARNFREPMLRINSVDLAFKASGEDSFCLT
jgi:hypothetical protein